MRKLLLSTIAALSPIIVSNNVSAFPFIKRNSNAPHSQTAPQNNAPQSQARPKLSPEIQLPGSEQNTAQAQAQAPLAPPASAQERLAAKSRDSLAQSTFWLAELQKAPKDEECAYEASRNLRLIGSYDRAIEIAAIGIQSNENSGRLWASLGLAFLTNKQNSEAAQALSKAISMVPNDPMLHNALGIAYDSLNRFDLASTAYNDGLKINPNDTAILSNLGLSQALSGNLPLAEATLRRAVSHNDAPIQARQNLALIVGLQGRLSEAETIAAHDLTPEAARANIAYIREMLNGGGDNNRWGTPKQSSQIGATSHASN